MEGTHPPLVHIRENPEFHRLMNVDKSAWPGCLLWHGWLPASACPGRGSLWADSAGDVGLHRLECALGAYSEDVCPEWVVTYQFRADLADSHISDDPDVWTDGSCVADDLSGIGAGGCGVYRSGSSWFQRRRRHLDLLPADGGLSVDRCTLFDSVPGPPHSVQEADM